MHGPYEDMECFNVSSKDERDKNYYEALKVKEADEKAEFERLKRKFEGV